MADPKLAVAQPDPAVLAAVKECATLRPGETLVVGIAGKLTREQFDEVTYQMQDRLPGVKVLIVNAEGLAVYRPDGTDG